MLEALTSAFLVSGVVFPGIAAHTAVYLTLGCMALSLIGASFDDLKNPVAKGLVVGVSFLIASVLPHSAHLDNWLVIAMVAPALLAIPTARLLHSITPRHFASLCVIGAIAGLVAGGLDAIVYDARRAGFGNNPIQYASLMIVIGFGALAGVASTPGKWRFIYLVGPVAAVCAVLLSGSRGPFLATGVLWLVALGVFRKDRHFLGALIILPLLAGVCLIAAGYGQRAISIVHGLSAPGSDMARMTMYRAAWHLFTDSPLWGHGLSRMMPLAQERYGVGDFDNLHFDIGNFIAAGGILGAAAYFSIICAPLLAFLDARLRNDMSVVYLALYIPAAHLALGMTMTTLGVLTRTVLFSVAVAYLIALTRTAIMESEAPLSGTTDRKTGL